MTRIRTTTSSSHRIALAPPRGSETLIPALLRGAAAFSHCQRLTFLQTLPRAAGMVKQSGVHCWNGQTFRQNCTVGHKATLDTPTTAARRDSNPHGGSETLIPALLRGAAAFSHCRTLTFLQALPRAAEMVTRPPRVPPRQQHSVASLSRTPAPGEAPPTPSQVLSHYLIST